MKSLDMGESPSARRGSIGTDQPQPASERLTTMEREGYVQGAADDHDSSVGCLGDDEEEEAELKENNKKLLTSSSAESAI